MVIADEGVLEGSFMDFTIPSEFARRALYCCPQFGHFICNNKYRVEREHLDLFLLMYIRKGSLTVESRGHVYVAGQGDVLFLDCRSPHAYYCTDSVDFLWIHFFGSSSAAYAEHLYALQGVLFSGNPVSDMDSLFVSVIRRAGAVVINEHQISATLHQILAELSDVKQYASNTFSVLQPAIHYIRDHYIEEIDLDRLSELCSVSKPHLIRCFKKYLSSTPHEYLLACRIRHAKQQLIISPLSIEAIAESCGFNSASHFTRSFHKNTGSTPSEFRRMSF